MVRPLKLTQTTNYRKLLSQHPVFSLFSLNELTKLVKNCHVFHYQTHEVIVKEGDPVDAIFLIVKGRCEVNKYIESGNPEYQPVAILKKGESIGLNAFGFYSETGVRTATVKALTPVELLCLDLNQFYSFLKKYPHPNAMVLKQLQMLLRMYFIKSVAPFTTLPNGYKKQIAEQIDEVNYPANTILFKEGDVGDFCYIIKKGKVEISIEINTGRKKILAELEPGNVFGESALILDAPRNATARLIKHSELLRIEKNLLKEILQKDVDAANALMNLQLRRSRPIKEDHIEVFSRQAKDGSRITILKNIKHDKYFQFPDEGLYIWQHLDGQTSLNELSLRFYSNYGSFNPENISAFIINLFRSGFIKLDAYQTSYDISYQKLPWWSNAIAKVRKAMEFKIAFKNVDPWLTYIFNRYIWVCYTKPVQIIFAIITILGFATFLKHLPVTINYLAASNQKWALFFLANFIVGFTVPLHELAHAFTTKYYGRGVICFGLGWMWIFPFAYCDTSDMWLASSRQRLWVDLAGVYLNAILAGITSLVTVFTIHVYPELTTFLILFSLASYLMIFGNLNMAIELDGYYALMDFLDKPNLRISATKWLISTFKNAERKNFLQNIKVHQGETIFWFMSLVYILILAPFVGYYIFHYLLAGLFRVTNIYFPIVLMLFVLCLSLLGLYNNVMRINAVTISRMRDRKLDDNQ